MPTATTARKGIGGPKTPEGKRRVSINALKHGLCAESQQGLQEVARIIGAEFEDILGGMLAHSVFRDLSGARRNGNPETHRPQKKLPQTS